MISSRGIRIWGMASSERAPSWHFWTHFYFYFFTFFAAKWAWKCDRKGNSREIKLETWGELWISLHPQWGEINRWGDLQFSKHPLLHTSTIYFIILYLIISLGIFHSIYTYIYISLSTSTSNNPIQVSTEFMWIYFRLFPRHHPPREISSSSPVTQP